MIDKSLSINYLHASDVLIGDKLLSITHKIIGTVVDVQKGAEVTLKFRHADDVAPIDFKPDDTLCVIRSTELPRGTKVRCTIEVQR